MCKIRIRETAACERRRTQITSNEAGVGKIDVDEIVPAHRGQAEIGVAKRAAHDLRTPEEGAWHCQIRQVRIRDERAEELDSERSVVELRTARRWSRGSLPMIEETQPFELTYRPLVSLPHSGYWSTTGRAHGASRHQDSTARQTSSRGSSSRRKTIATRTFGLAGLAVVARAGACWALITRSTAAPDHTRSSRFGRLSRPVASGSNRREKPLQFISAAGPFGLPHPAC